MKAVVFYESAPDVVAKAAPTWPNTGPGGRSSAATANFS